MTGSLVPHSTRTGSSAGSLDRTSLLAAALIALIKDLVKPTLVLKPQSLSSNSSVQKFENLTHMFTFKALHCVYRVMDMSAI